MRPPVRKYMGEDLDINRRRPESQQAHSDVFFIHSWVAAEHFIDLLKHGTDLSNGALVSQPQRVMEPEFVACGNVLQADRRDLSIGDADQGTIVGSDTSRPQPDFD